ncbi:anti-sigma factor family protein [Streptomyces sp. G45]|uniref:anti-sigma factor family protein n=1 Tax=Streptomyces sp. G45 TaxID=3406627 RepID=UPI003C1329DD
MTTTTDSAGHPDVDELSDLTEGLLSPSRTRDVREHLDDCALCTDVYDSLEEIRGLLGTLPGAPRMPADVAERIDAALAAEALLDATAPDADVSRETSTAAPSEPAAAGSAPSAGSATASVTASESVPSGSDTDESTTIGATTAGASPSDTSSGAAASGPSSRATADRPAGHARGATGPGRGRRERARRRTAVLGTVFTVAALGLGSLLVLQPWESDSKGSKETASSRTDGPHTFTEGKLKGQVAKLLDQGPSKQGAGKPTTSFGTQTDPGSPRRGPSEKGPDSGGEGYPTLPVCIEQGLDLDGRAPLAVDQGTYEGKDAYLVVATHETDGSKVSAYIVDAACVKASSAPGTVAKVLLTQSYPRG